MTAPDPASRVDADALRAEATRRSGSSAWGENDGFSANLNLLIESCRSTARLSPLGWDVLAKVAMRHLVNRLALQAHLTKRPALNSVALPGPIVITGLPRTGTTLLHQLMALDPENRVLRFWEALRPAPPAEDLPSREERHAQAARWLDRFYELAPEFRAIHHRTPDGPEECDALLQNSFASQHFGDMFDAADYSRWLGTANLGAEYADYRTQLKLLTHADSDAGGDRRWVLKSPSHLGHLDALLGVLPDTVIVHCHRAPSRAAASHASLVLALRRAYSRQVDPAMVASQVLDGAVLAMQRALDVRSSGLGSFVDVSYQELAADPMRAMAWLYERLGRDLPPSLVRRIEQWSAENPRHTHGVHRYDPADFGLDDTTVRERFGRYLTSFGELIDGSRGNT